MNKIKRFLSVIIVAAMIMSLNAVAFAAESDNSSVSADTEVVSSSSTNGIDPLSDPAPLTSEQHVRNIKNDGGKLADLPSRKNITIVISTPVKCTVTVYYENKEISRQIDTGSGRYTICAGKGSGFTYSIRFDTTVNYAVYQFFATDGNYDGWHIIQVIVSFYI